MTPDPITMAARARIDGCHETAEMLIELLAQIAALKDPTLLLDEARRRVREDVEGRNWAGVPLHGGTDERE